MNKRYEKQPAHLAKLANIKMSHMPKPKSNLTRVRNLSDAAIATDIANDPDVAPELIDWPKDAHVLLPQSKIPVSLRVDADIVDFFRKQGSGYLSRMNAVLRAYVEATRKKKTA